MAKQVVRQSLNRDEFSQLVSDIAKDLRDRILSEVRESFGGTAPVSNGNADIPTSRRDMARRVYERESGQTADAIEQPVVRRRRRRAVTPSKAYSLNNTRKNATEPDLFSTALTVYRALRKGESMTVRDIMKVTGLKDKTVQSCLWYLRNHDDAGNRVKPGARAIAVSTENETE